MKTKLLLCVVLAVFGFLAGCASKPSQETEAISHATPFAAALKKYHHDAGDYPQQLNDLYPRYLGTDVLWYNYKDHEHTWVLDYQRVDQNDYKFFLYSSPCSQAVFDNGTFKYGCGPSYRSLTNWPVFYSSDDVTKRLFIRREPLMLEWYTNEIQSWNEDLREPTPAKINSAEVKELGRLKGLRVIEVKLSLASIYYTDAQIILEEIEPDDFLPVYVQDYNNDIRAPSTEMVRTNKTAMTISAGMDYCGTGHFHSHYKITVALMHNPEVSGSLY